MFGKSFVKSFGDYDSVVEHKTVQHHVSKPKKQDSVVGKMVKHKTLGNGVVIAENGNVLTIAFKSKGVKNIVREFIEFI